MVDRGPIRSPGAPPLLFAERREDAALPTVLIYGHGDVVAGYDEQWDDGRSPWELRSRDGKWYGRGTADNKGQHTINLAALARVLASRGRLGFNAKLLLEMGEEIGSPGLHLTCERRAESLSADVLIASDGPRLAPLRRRSSWARAACSISILSVELARRRAPFGQLGRLAGQSRERSWPTRSPRWSTRAAASWSTPCVPAPIPASVRSALASESSRANPEGRRSTRIGASRR